MDPVKTYSAFAGERQIATGDLRTVLSTTKTHLHKLRHSQILIFEDQTGKQVDFDFSGTVAEVIERAIPTAPERSGPGRPKLGVVSREVSLLPRHWEWLESEPPGISATLRRLVDEAKKKNPAERRERLAREAVNRFITAMAGNLENYEEATRALFARDDARFAELIRAWPRDIRRHALSRLERTPDESDTRDHLR